MIRLFLLPTLLFCVGLACDYYIFHRYLTCIASPLRWLWWLPSLATVAMAVYFIFFGRGMHHDFSATLFFMLLLGLFFIPKIVFTPLALIPRVGPYLGGALATCIVGIVLWGITFGFSRLQVRHVTYESADLPESFDGYRIVQFSDAHTGSFIGPYKHLVDRSVDTINALKPDLICFVGDIENFSPEELLPHREAYSRLSARDGVLTIMGNHDYSTYLRLSPQERSAQEQVTRQLQQSFGWRMLSNEHLFVTRPSLSDSTQTDSIAIIGEENWGLPPFPQFGRLDQALNGLVVKDGQLTDSIDTPLFSVMLSHDPTAWGAHILPVFRPHVTLSGHTHGTQFSLFGWSPASRVYKEWGGSYYGHDYGAPYSLLSVSTGFGGNFPFRFNMPREVVVITLHHKSK